MGAPRRHLSLHRKLTTTVSLLRQQNRSIFLTSHEILFSTDHK
jgi:hypothetical protein